MLTWDKFYPDVLPEVLGCPEPSVDRALLHAARDFFGFTQAWRVDLDAIIVAAGLSTYSVELPTGSELLKVLDATLGGNTIRIESSLGTTLRQRTNGTGGRRIQMVDSDTVLLLPTPAEDGAELIITATLVPSDTARGVPDAQGNDNRLAIANGALAMLLTMNKAPWANPSLAQLKAAQFRQDKGDTQKRVFRAYSNRSPRVRAQYF